MKTVHVRNKKDLTWQLSPINAKSKVRTWRVGFWYKILNLSYLLSKCGPLLSLRAYPCLHLIHPWEVVVAKTSQHDIAIGTRAFWSSACQLITAEPWKIVFMMASRLHQQALHSLTGPDDSVAFGTKLDLTKEAANVAMQSRRVMWKGKR